MCEKIKLKIVDNKKKRNFIVGFLSLEGGKSFEVDAFVFHCPVHTVDCVAVAVLKRCSSEFS